MTMACETLGAELVAVRTAAEVAVRKSAEAILPPPVDRVLVLDFRVRRTNP